MSLFSFIKNNIPIIDEVSRYVRLRPAGTYMKGPCPFHRETDASFTVSPDKKIFYCFGCHASGDVVAFVAKAENVGAIEAARMLIESHNLTVPESILKSSSLRSGGSADERASYFALQKRVAQWCREQYARSKVAQEYVTNRAISKESQERFGIGYFPGGAKALSHLVSYCQAENILAKDLIAAGILFDSRGHLRSPLEERILFPIVDAMGRNCGFGGRVFMANDDRAKYYNSKDSRFFQKGSLLFGYWQAKNALKEKHEAFLVEGYTDCLAMAQYGYDNVVATLGTACTLEHLQMLSRLVDRVMVVYDGDGAGRKAMMRLAHLCWQVNLELYVITLPKGLDPAAYLAQEGSLSALYDSAVDIFTFFVTASADDFAQKRLAEKMTIIDSVLELIGSLSDLVKQDLLLQELHARVGVPLPALRSRLKGEKGSYRDADMREVKNEKVHDELSDGHVIGVLANALARGVVVTCDPLVGQVLGARAERILEKLNTNDSENEENDRFHQFLERLTDDDRQWVIAMATQFSGVVGERECNSVLEKVLTTKWKEEARQLRVAIAEATKQKEQDTVRTLLETFERRKEQMQRKGLIQWQKKQQQS
jgi:DNA primase